MADTLPYGDTPALDEDQPVTMPPMPSTMGMDPLMNIAMAPGVAAPAMFQPQLEQPPPWGHIPGDTMDQIARSLQSANLPQTDPYASSLNNFLQHLARGAIGGAADQRATAANQRDTANAAARLEAQKSTERAEQFRINSLGKIQQASIAARATPKGFIKAPPGMPPELVNDEGMSRVSDVSDFTQGKLAKTASIDDEGVLHPEKMVGRAEFDEELKLFHAKNPSAAYMTGVDPKAIAQAIKRGDLPPDLRLYTRGQSGAVATELTKIGYDYTKSNLDYTAVQHHFATMNNQQQTAIRTAATTIKTSLDSIDSLSKELNRVVPLTGTRADFLNAVAGYVQKHAGPQGQQAQDLASRLDQQIADVTTMLAQVYMGGGVPSDKAMALAAHNLSENWNYPNMRSATNLMRNNITMRLNSMNAPAVSPSNPAGSAGGFSIGERQFPAAPEQPIMIQIRTPKGDIVSVPQSQVQEATSPANGGKVVW